MRLIGIKILAFCFLPLTLSAQQMKTGLTEKQKAHGWCFEYGYYSNTKAYSLDNQNNLQTWLINMPVYKTLRSAKRFNPSILHTLTVKVDFTMNSLWIFMKDKNDTLITEDANEYSRALSAGTYELITGFVFKPSELRLD